MIIIIGLGNPGIKFKNTRHNVGFEAIDKFAKENNFLEFELQKKFNAEISENELNGEKIILAKPQTFMNDSGKAVKKITRLYTLDPIPLVVVHDDIDLPIGKIKIVKDRGSAGHKGVESIITEIGSSDFARFRIGIAPQNSLTLIAGQAPKKEIKAEQVVLKKFSPEEKEKISEAIKKTVEALNYFIENGLEKTMNKYN